MALLQNNITTYPPQTKLVIALSGGVDSVVLLDYFKNHSHIRVIHINHNISKNSNLWQDFCIDLCKKLKIKIEVISVSINGVNNLEQKARDLRYQALFSNLKNDEILLTAHHQNDQAETVLLNLCRGSGVLGLAGMELQKPKHHRPFLEISKDWILDYSQRHNLKYISDESNLDTNFRRNFMRLDILPLLQTKYSAIVKTLVRVAKNQQSSLKLNDDLAQIDIENLNLIIENRININNLKTLKTHRIVNIIYYHLRKLDFSLPSAKIMEQILTALNTKNDTKVLIKWGNYSVRKFMGELYFVENKEQDDFCPLFLELSTIAGFNIKYRQNGQRVKFSNKTHSQSLKKLMQEYKILPWERDKIRLYYLFDKLIAIEKIGKL